MIQNGMYFAKHDFYQFIRDIGGSWNDSKERPIVCLLPSVEHEHLFWAIPVGNFDHRSPEAKERIKKYLSYDESDIRSCYYHIGNTDVRSIFFMSDIIPIHDQYIDREYIGKYTGSLYIIKNKKLIAELERKLKRILSWENARPNFFRQHITDLKNHLIAELEQEQQLKETAITKEEL